jgi:hypothetical protein
MCLGIAVLKSLRTTCIEGVESGSVVVSAVAYHQKVRSLISNNGREFAFSLSIQGSPKPTQPQIGARAIWEVK